MTGNTEDLLMLQSIEFRGEFHKMVASQDPDPTFSQGPTKYTATYGLFFSEKDEH